MKFFASLAIAVALVASPAAAQKVGDTMVASQVVAPADPLTGAQGSGELGGTTALGIAAAVITVGLIIASNDDDDDSTSGTTD